MKKSTIINPAQEQDIINALHQPHNLFMADELLKINVDSFNVSLSVGMRNPVGQLAPSFTVKMPLSFAVELSKALLAEIENNKDQIKSEHEELYNALK